MLVLFHSLAPGSSWRFDIAFPKCLRSWIQCGKYGEPENGTNRQRLSCKLCGQGMTEGISRLKYHLAKIMGRDILICTESTPEIMRMAHDAIYEKDRKKEVAVANRAGTASGGVTRTSRTTDNSRFVSGSTGLWEGLHKCRFTFHEGLTFLSFCSKDQRWGSTFHLING